MFHILSEVCAERKVSKLGKIELVMLTKLSLDDGHVWNALVTIVISNTIEILRCNINGRNLRSFVATHLAVNLRQKKSEDFTSIMLYKVSAPMMGTNCISANVEV